MIGQVFRNHLRSYSHWAFGDIDVSYGAFRNFLTPQVLAHDFVTFRTDDLCFPMTKTIFAGQLTIARNNNYTRTLYKAEKAFARMVHDERFLFFDERMLPWHVLMTAPARVAMVIGQLTDRTNAKRASPHRFSRRLLWHARSGRLVVVQSHGQSSPHRHLYERCIEGEFALVHLQLYKFKHFNASLGPFAAQELPIGFVYSLERGMVPLRASSQNNDGDAEAHDILEQLTRGELKATCEMKHGGWVYAGVVSP